MWQWHSWGRGGSQVLPTLTLHDCHLFHPPRVKCLPPALQATLLPLPSLIPPPLPGHLTSSSGFSSLSPTCSSGRRRWVLGGFLRRMEPRDSSVMLWICGRERGSSRAGEDAGHPSACSFFPAQTFHPRELSYTQVPPPVKTHNPEIAGCFCALWRVFGPIPPRCVQRAEMGTRGASAWQGSRGRWQQLWLVLWTSQ